MKADVEKLETASLISRIVAFAIDFGLPVVLSVFSSIVIYYGLQSSNTKLANTIALQNENISSSHLAKLEKGKYNTYTSDDYFQKTDNGYLIIDSLSYFYTIYLAGDATKASTGDIVAMNANDEKVIDGVTTTPNAYYTVDWFNTNILGLKNGEHEAKNINYFSYQMNGEDIDYSKIGTINKEYLVEQDGVVTVNASEEMINYIFDIYKQSAKLLYAQDYMVKYQNYIDGVNSLVTFICRFSFALIFFEILPLALARGKSLGKLLMRLSLVRPNNDPISRWQVIPRGLIILLIPVALYLIQNLFIQIGIVAVLLLVSIILYFVNKNTRMVLHDLISQTVVIEDPEKRRA